MHGYDLEAVKAAAAFEESKDSESVARLICIESADYVREQLKLTPDIDLDELKSRILGALWLRNTDSAKEATEQLKQGINYVDSFNDVDELKKALFLD